MVETEFDLLHVVPPNTSHKFVRDSPLTSTGNFIDVDINTLQHPKYPNVFALGDCAATPTAKTSAAVFCQSPVVVNNLIKFADNKVLNAKYEGYSSCPLFVGDNKLMLMEFKYGDQPNETFSTK
jgi:NADPH-dependent 2,4-dienoyl-CoA reductase/sulfur reductase-like enzyme